MTSTVNDVNRNIGETDPRLTRIDTPGVRQATNVDRLESPKLGRRPFADCPRCPPRWKSAASSAKKKVEDPIKAPRSTGKDRKPLSKREDFIRNISRSVDLSFYMVSSISSLGEGSFTTINEEDNSDGVEDEVRACPLSQLPLVEPENQVKTRISGCTSMNAVHHSRWDIGTQDSVPASPRRGRSFESKRALNAGKETAVRRTSADTLPIIPLRRWEAHEEDIDHGEQ